MNEQFATAINCMDGRVQVPVIEYIKANYSVEYVDMITEPGPVKILADNTDENLLKSIDVRIDISVNKHKSKRIFVVGHYDCAGNPTGKENQLVHIKKSVENLRQKYPEVEIVGLWVNENWSVEPTSV